MEKKRILITGITGQMAYFCAKKALNSEMKVIGTARYCTNLNEKLKDREEIINHPDFILENLSLEDQSSIDTILSLYKPDYVINTAAQAHVGESWKIPEYTMNVTGLGVLRILESIKKHSKGSKLIQCSSSEMFGKYTEGVIDEKTPMCSRSPYAVAKTCAHLMIDVYRKSFGIKACCAIMFNYEGFMRKPEYYTRKVTTEMAKIKRGESDKIKLGSLDFCRDWGYAGDYAEAMFLMLENNDECKDYVISTGVTKTGRDFLEIAFKYANEKMGKEFFSFDKHVECNVSDYVRPNDVVYLRGCSLKIQEELGWEPKYSLEDIIAEMVDFDVFGENK